MNQPTLWDIPPEPVQEPPPGPREWLYEWGKSRGFAEFSFHLEGYQGFIPKGEAAWKLVREPQTWKGGSLSSDLWLKCAVQAAREADALDKSRVQL